MLLLNIISELLRDQTLVGQPKELPCRLKIKVIYFGGFCYLMNGTFMSFSRYEFEAKLSDRCLRWFRLHTNLYKFGKLFLQLSGTRKIAPIYIGEDIFTPFHF